MVAAADFSVLAARIANDLAKIANDIAALQAKEGGINPADLQPSFDALTAAAKAMEDIDAGLNSAGSTTLAP